MNGHVGAEVDGFEGVHGGYGFGRRNVDGEMLLEFADALDFAIVNTWFKKEVGKMITYVNVNVNVTDTILWQGHHDRVMQLN